MTNTVDVLLVEDNKGDVALIERAFEDRALPGTLHAVQTGTEALDWLHRREGFAEAPRPDVVLLDLNLPAMSGHAVLEDVKSDPQLKQMPVIVLTSSRSEDDIRRAYEACANSCLTKPVDPDEYIDLIQTVVNFWASIAELPPLTDGSSR